MNQSIISSIDAEIARLQQARDLLSSVSEGSAAVEAIKRGPGRPKGSGVKSAAPQPPIRKKRIMSDEARARIAAAQKKRWAAAKKA